MNSHHYHTAGHRYRNDTTFGNRHSRTGYGNSDGNACSAGYCTGRTGGSTP